MATVTAVQPPGRFGALDIDEDRVGDFPEKPQGDGGWINGGFFVLSPAVVELIATTQGRGNAGRWSRWRARTICAHSGTTASATR